MLMLVALAAAAGLVILLAPVMVVRYLVSPPVLVFLLVCLGLLAAPLVYAWRTGVFRSR
jgi:hypothetical protein